MADTPTPNWDNAPTWAQWWAQDGDGHAYWYATAPTIDPKAKGWLPQNLTVLLEYDFHGSTPWRRPREWMDSLKKRPTA